MRFLISIVAVVLASILSSCYEDEPASSVPTFANRLALGTGANASNSALTGEGTAFRALGGVAVIYWRLESAADFAGSGVSLKIEKKSGNTFATIGTYPYGTPRNYGHMVLSSISLADAGTFRATGVLTESSADVASTMFTVQW